MNILRKILRFAFPFLFDYVEVYDVRFVPEVNTKSVANMLKSDEFKFFMDNCERKARYTLSQDEYKGVVFVSTEAGAMSTKLKPKKKADDFSSMLRLDDEGLLKEARSGKAAN